MTTDTDETTADRFGLTSGTGATRATGLASLTGRNRKPADTAAGQAAGTADDGSADGPLTLASLPDPDADAGTTAELTEAERRDLELCERAVRSHHTAYWLTGKALDAVANRHLYRGDYATFDDLLADWGINLADSSRMRRGWRLAERLLPNFPKLTVSHLEALFPAVKLYDVEAAATLYTLLRESRSKVTARDVSDLVRELPGPDGSAAPADAIREQLEAKLTEPAAQPEPMPGDHSGEADGGPGAGSPSGPTRHAVDQRARQLTRDLKRPAITRRGVCCTIG
ncbi:hypothetical protein [Streptomyces sp. 1222.5]|uniref:hypothetical protein n=1 Tax=Streptomyces sp. 1222.5 TaxID=1881026 RepID=UPI003D71C380